MDYKKTKAPLTTITRNLGDLDGETDNIYQTVKIAAARANQISVEMKQELNRKLEEFASYTDNLEEVFENPEQIEISRFFERLPKPSLISLQELGEDQIYFRINEAPEIEEK
jgi:DNA-directed RNA polymerase subunit K/omega